MTSRACKFWLGVLIVISVILLAVEMGANADAVSYFGWIVRVG